MITAGIDHIALTMPNLDEQVDRLTSAFGMVVESRFEASRSSPTPRRD
jgi:catechol 2,3-dioxygenase-like lactoylglutathione lyase family enzyme